MDTWFPTFRRLANTQVPFATWWPWYTTAGQRQSLLRLIVVAAEENLLLAPLIESWAADERGVQHRRLHRLARLLKDGTPLPEAVEQVPGVLRDEDVLAIRFGTQSGTLAASVRAMLDESQPLPEQPPRGIRGTLIYFCVVLLLGIAVVAFTQIEIFPELYMMHWEFGLEPGSALEWSTRFSGFVADYWWLGALAIIALLWLTYSAPGRFVRRAVLGRFSRLQRAHRSADLLKKLSVAMEAGRPIPGALSTLARYHFDPTLRHKLLFVRNEVEQGVDVWQSMATVSLLTMPQVRVLETAERIGNRPWALKQLAFAIERQRALSLHQISGFLPPVVVILLGVFVLLHGFAMFLPLVELILGFS